MRIKAKAYIADMVRKFKVRGYTEFIQEAHWCREVWPTYWKLRKFMAMAPEATTTQGKGCFFPCRASRIYNEPGGKVKKSVCSSSTMMALVAK